MPDPTDRLITLLEALDGVAITDAELASLVWLSGWEKHTVENVAALLCRARRSTVDLCAALVAAGYDDDEIPFTIVGLEHFAEHGVLPEAGGTHAR